MKVHKQPHLSAYLFLLASRYKVFFSALFVVAIVSQILSTAIDYQIKEIIDAIAARNIESVGLYISLFILYTFLCHGSFFVQRLFAIKYKPVMFLEIVTGIYEKTMNHSLHWFDSHLSGEISSKITDFEDSLGRSITCSYSLLSNFFSLIISIIFISQVSQAVTLSMAIFVCVYAPIMYHLLKKQLSIQEEYAKSRQRAIGIINDSVSNIFGIKIIGSVARELKTNLLPAIINWKNWDKKSRQYDAYYVDLTDTILKTIFDGVQIWLSAYLYIRGHITAGDFAFIAITLMAVRHHLDSMIENILFNLNPQIAKVKASYAFINTNLDTQNKNDAIELPRVSGKIEYKNVVFSYADGKNIFDNFNLNIKAGERVGIVGTSGAGKTTLIKCLLRYFDVKDGSILVDGYDIKGVTQESLRANISVIPQDITMFHRSVLENLQIAKENATIEEIKEACKKARIHDDIELMTNGYDSVVGERGVKMSGGQRQRVAIARAILKNAPLLILDEATSALDTPTEHLIQDSINEMLEASKATTIVIAHRLSTLLHMDRILVFEKGKIVQEGSHKELVKKDGVYKKLWSAQVGGFLS